MAKAGKTLQKEIELEPDAWERFERAVKMVATSPPQHKTSKKSSTKAKGRGAAFSKPKSA